MSIQIYSKIEMIKESVRDAWEQPPANIPHDYYAKSMIETVNKEVRNWAALITETGQDIKFITAALNQVDGISRGDIKSTLSSRLNIANSNGMGVCLVDVVADIVAELTVQQLAPEGVEKGYFTRRPDRSIDLTPNSPKNA